MPDYSKNLFARNSRQYTGSYLLNSQLKRELWSFHKYLTCSTYFMDGKIITILVIPLVRLDRKFEVYKAIAVPTLSQKTIINPENQYTNL